MDLVALYGTGDTYLVCALHAAYERAHGQARIVLKSAHTTIARMFDVPYLVNDDLVRAVENSPNLWDLENPSGGRFFVHPHFRYTATRVDQLTVKSEVTQADMYRVILGLPHDAPLSRPHPPEIKQEHLSVLLLPEARSWPNIDRRGWEALASDLQSQGWRVRWNDPAWDLAELFTRIAKSSWLIGPQCGVMAIACHARFRCRKTIIAPPPNFFGLEHAYPYGYVSKFAGEDHDVEELTSLDQVNLAHRAHDPSPVTTIWAPLSPGDFIDRLAVLSVKRLRFNDVQRASLDREYFRFTTIFEQRSWPSDVHGLYQRLYALHLRTFDLFQETVPLAIDDRPIGQDAHEQAIRLNKERVALKNEIDALCHGPYTEVKSYYR